MMADFPLGTSMARRTNYGVFLCLVGVGGGSLLKGILCNMTCKAETEVET